MTDNIARDPSVPASGLPDSLRLFERLQGSALVVGWANATLAYHDLLRGHIHPLLFATALCALSAVVFVLVALISRRHSARCKWILIVLSAVGIGPWFVLLQHIGTVNLPGLLLLAQGALQFGSCALLMAGDSQAWFAGRED
jgi:hypothetical protein